MGWLEQQLFRMHRRLWYDSYRLFVGVCDCRFGDQVVVLIILVSASKCGVHESVNGRGKGG
jgi:hypothetical protein